MRSASTKLGLFDATMIVMGGIVGSGIFINPYVVARQVRTPVLILGAWALGGLIALAGAFIYAELATRLPEVGGQYAYLREAYHPAVAFLYGWVLLLVIQTGGMAAVAVTFAAYFRELAGGAIPPSALAALVLAGLAIVNCFGVRSGSSVQSGLMVLKIVAIAALVAGGGWFLFHEGAASAAAAAPPASPAAPAGTLRAMGVAMVPVLFAYGGWQTSSFVSEEIREPRRNLPRALVLGVAGVIVLYLGVNYVCVSVLGPAGLAATATPASAVMQRAFGRAGSRWIALGIAISALGFLSQSILTAPRVYYAMARDGLFFRWVGWLDPRHGVPTVAILLQAVMAIVIALSGRYDQILSYVVSMDFLFFGLTASCLFVFRRREKRGGARRDSRFPALARVPGHPVTTALFVAVSWLVVVSTIARYPVNTAVGMGILVAGIPVYLAWSRRKKGRS
ncbi:MAG TPA: amino acid permease [Thermoanaerobaculia bacterium]|nr:amino acid permease [Thermoanaerobaculia bacterium]